AAISSATRLAAPSTVNLPAASLPCPGRSGVRQWNSPLSSATWAAHDAPVRRVAWRKTIVGRASASGFGPPWAIVRARGLVVLVVDQLPIDRIQGGLRPALEVELAEDVADVGS